jgi:hypothetical protein
LSLNGVVCGSMGVCGCWFVGTLRKGLPSLLKNDPFKSTLKNLAITILQSNQTEVKKSLLKQPAWTLNFLDIAEAVCFGVN